MESKIYPWDTKEKQQEKEPYCFVDFKEDFLDLYRHRRAQVINELGHGTYPVVQLRPYNQTKLESLESFETARVVDTLYENGSIRRFTPLELKHFWRVLKKADLGKLTTRYDKDFINVTKKELDVQSKTLLSLALLDYSATKSPGYLQALSTSLKLNDSLVSEIDQLKSPLERVALSCSLEREAQEIGRLEEEVLQRSTRDIVSPGIRPVTPGQRVSKLGMVLQEGNRARAYLQALVSAGFYPNHVLLLRHPIYNTPLNQFPSIRKTLLFDPNMPEEAILKERAISYQVINSDSCNDQKVVETLRARGEEYFVFSGRGILKNIFDSGKKFIHVHPGKLPEYKGSTCFYYSILAEDLWTCTSFLMSPGVDEGDIITSRSFPIPAANIDPARVYDPYTRSEVLVDVIGQLANTGTIKAKKQNQSAGITYYIIHPVLRHLAEERIRKFGKKE